MFRLLSRIGICLIVLLLIASCATKQSRHVMLGETYPSKTEEDKIEVFRTELPERLFVRISRLDVHLEKAYFIGLDLDDALPELKKQARLSGADAIIEIQERSSMVGETKIYHVTATGIKYTDS